VNVELVLTLIIGALGSMPLIPALQKASGRVREPLTARAGVAFDAAVGMASVAGFASVFVYSSMLMAAGTYSPFIYFRF
jgi:alginate O-acetyltransferase complex protein AlgI